MGMKPLRPCRHPGCSALVEGGYCAAQRGPAQRRSPGVALDVPDRRMEAAPGGPASAGTLLPGGGSGLRPGTWTTRGTGASSRPLSTWKASATPATAAKPHGNCGKTGPPASVAEPWTRGSYGRVHVPRTGARGSLHPSHRVTKVLTYLRNTAGWPTHKKFSPYGDSPGPAALACARPVHRAPGSTACPGQPRRHPPP